MIAQNINNEAKHNLHFFKKAYTKKSINMKLAYIVTAFALSVAAAPFESSNNNQDIVS